MFNSTLILAIVLTAFIFSKWPWVIEVLSSLPTVNRWIIKAGVFIIILAAFAWSLFPDYVMALL